MYFALLKNRKFFVYFCSKFLYVLHSLRLRLDFDNSGPLLVLDVKSKSSTAVLQQMLDGTLISTFPKFSAREIEDNGILHGTFY